MRLRIGALVVVVFVVAAFTWGGAAQSGPRHPGGNHQGRVGRGLARRHRRGQGPDDRDRGHRRPRRLPHRQPGSRHLHGDGDPRGLCRHDDPGGDCRPKRNPPDARTARRRAEGNGDHHRIDAGRRHARRDTQARMHGVRGRAQPPRGDAGSRRRVAAAHARLQHRVVRPHRRERLQARRHRSALDVLDRRRHGVLRQRAPVPATTAGCRPDAVRIEELVNYFRYDYAAPDGRRAVRDHHRSGRLPVEPASTGWCASASRGARDAAARAGRRATSCSCIDVSGSMDAPDKLPLRAERDAACSSTSCGENDRVAIVVYAGASGLVLPSTPGDRQGRILARASTSCRPAARPTARPASSWPTRSRASTSSTAASTA